MQIFFTTPFYMRCIILFFGIFTNAFSVFAQSIDIPFLFKTGLRTQVSYMPIQAEDRFQMNIAHYQMQGIFSLKSKLNADISLKKLKFDVGLRQDFLTINAGMRVVNSDFFPANKPNYWGNITLGYTSIKAGLKNGVWVKTLQISAVQDVEDLGKARPFVLGAVAKVFILGLRTQNIFGVGVAYTPQGSIFPVPIIGFNRRLSEKWDMNLLIPANIAFIYKHNNKLRIRTRISPNALQVGGKNLPFFQTNTPDNSQNPPQNLQVAQANRFQYTALEANIGVQYQINKNLRMVGQVGYLFATHLNFREDKTKIGEVKLQNNFMPQFTFGFHFSLSDGIFGSQMFMAD